MKRFYLSKLLTLIAILSGLSNGVDAQTVTFGYSGSPTFWTCPSGVTSVSVDMTGAKGGNGYFNYSRGGFGGRVLCNLTVVPGTVYQINIGGAGQNQPCCGTLAGGFNGGGAGLQYGGSGGGASDIRVAPYGLSDRIVVAGGGGGGGYNYSTTDYDRGGNGGGLTGEAGYTGGGTSGGGGSQSAGGLGGNYPGYTPGNTGTFGNGGSGVNTGAGGGGGYYGGGGGNWSGGGGGSSFPAAVGGAITTLTHTQGFNTTGNGSLTLVGPTVSTSTSSLAFGGITVGATSPTQSFTLSGVNLCSSPLTITPPTDFEISLDGGTSWSSIPVSVTFTPPTLTARTVMVRFMPVSYSAYASTITFTGGCSAGASVNVSGTGSFPCSGTPSAGAASATPTTGRGTTPFTLSLTGSSTSGGITYQWQSSSFSTFGYSNIAGATSSTYNFIGITSPTFYRCVVSCPFSGGGSSNSTATFIGVDLSPSSCTPTCNYFNSNCGNTFYVGTSSNPVLFPGASGTSINDANACSTTSAYADRTATMGVTLNMGSTYVPTVGGVTGNQCSSQFWIDFNNDGTFTSTESVGGTTSFSSGRNSPTITIPTTVTPGVYRMRIIVAYSAGFAPGNANYPSFPLIPPCPTTSVYYADTRDYTATIQGPACTGVPTPGSITADVSSSCASFTSNMLYTPPGITSGFTYQWQRSTSSGTTGFTNIAGATTAVLTASVSGTIWYRTNVTCTNSSASAPSTSIAMAINPSPSSIVGNTNVCIGTPSSYTSATAGGTWVSSNPAVATVGVGTGVVTGISPGATVLSYILPTGCFTTANLSVFSGAAAITGATTVCEAASTTLSNVTPGGTWSSSNTAQATVGMTTGIVSGVMAGNPTITYMLPTGCTAMWPITVNPLPAAITGTNNVCVGLTTSLSNVTPGGLWYSTNTFQATIGSVTGLVTGVAAGSPSMVYSLPTGCAVTYPVTINANPAALTGTATACVGATTTLSAIGAGTFTSGNPSLATVDAITGDVTGVAAGSPVISFTSGSTGCYTTLPVTIFPTPAAYAVTGGGGYCPSGTGVHIGLASSASGVDYQLYYAGDPTGMPMVPGSTSGLDFGVFAGIGNYTVMATNTITGCTSNMLGSATVTNFIAPAAFNVTGGGSYCAGGAGSEVTLDGSVIGVKYQLYNTTSVGLEVSGTGGPITFGNQTGAGTYTVMARDEATLCTSAMNGSADVTISLRPAAHNVSTGGRYCAGGAGVPVTLDASTPGVNYRLIYAGVAIDSLFGTGTMLDFGPRTGAGSYTMDGINISNNCSSNMTGSAVIGINPLPNISNVTGGGSFCAGSTGVRVGLDFSTIGTDYQLSNSLTGVVTTMGGSNSGLDFGVMTAPGVYTVLATIASTGCTRNMTGSATVVENVLPTAFSVTDGGDYCAGGSGVPVGLSGSEAGIRYQLYRGGSPIGAMVNGTTLAITFGLQTGTGTYTVRAYNAATGCSADMTGGVSVGIQALPLVYNVTGGGNYCAGGAGSNVFLSNSQIDVNYELWVGTTLAATLAGTGAALDFGPQTIAGTYRVIATNATTPCTRNMSGTVSIGINPLPAAYRVTGSGAICAGGAGLNIGINPTNTGITYQLMLAGSPVGAALGGTGFPIDFGVHAAAGTYTVEARNNITGCTNTMTGSAVRVVNQLPDVFTVNGGGIYCEGTGGVPVGLDSAVTGINYQLWRDGVSVGSLVTGSGPITFGSMTATGTYTVKATDPATTCSATMAGSANVLMNAAPTVYRVSGGGNYCAGGTGVSIHLAGSNLGGITYQLYKDGTSYGSFYAGTGLPLDFGAFTPAGVYKVVATNSSTLCSSNMTDSATVVITPNVIPEVTVNTVGSTVCNGATASFSATAVNGGTSPRYEWKVNGASVGFGDTYSYSPAEGDSVSTVLTSSERCTSPATATGSVIMHVNPNVLPTVAVSVNTGSTVCPGVSSTFTANPTFGGTAPLYTWMKNGLTVGTSAGTYTTTANDSDVIFCTLTSNYECRTSDFVLSNNVIMTVDAPIAPVFTLTANPGTTTIATHSVTFTANVTNVSVTNVTYQWSVNGTAVAGATNSTYTTNTLANFDVVRCCVTNSNTCGASAPVCETQTIVVNSNVGVNTVAGGVTDIKIMPNPNKGAFTVKGAMNATGNQEVVIEVTNMLGQVVYTNKVATNNGVINEQIQLNSSLSNGMYILNMRSGTDNAVFHFVIEQ